MSGFVLKSATFKNGDTLPMLHVFNGCGGQNKVPELTWENAPEQTKSFAITVYDPDAPTGSGWWHWVIINIPASIFKISENSIPSSALQLRNDYGEAKYDGACPPVGHGKHHYIFRVYALDIQKLDLPLHASPAMAGFNINAHMIAKAEIVTTFERK